MMLPNFEAGERFEVNEESAWIVAKHQKKRSFITNGFSTVEDHDHFISTPSEPIRFDVLLYIPNRW